MKKIVLAIFATLMFTGCLFSKKEEAPAEQPAPGAEQQAPADANNAPAPAEPAPAE
jgi:hypothetical protein